MPLAVNESLNLSNSYRHFYWKAASVAPRVSCSSSRLLERRKQEESSSNWSWKAALSTHSPLIFTWFGFLPLCLGNKMHNLFNRKVSKTLRAAIYCDKGVPFSYSPADIPLKLLHSSHFPWNTILNSKTQLHWPINKKQQILKLEPHFPFESSLKRQIHYNIALQNMYKLPEPKAKLVIAKRVRNVNFRHNSKIIHALWSNGREFRSCAHWSHTLVCHAVVCRVFCGIRFLFHSCIILVGYCLSAASWSLSFLLRHRFCWWTYSLYFLKIILTLFPRHPSRQKGLVPSAPNFQFPNWRWLTRPRKRILGNKNIITGIRVAHVSTPSCSRQLNKFINKKPRGFINGPFISQDTQSKKAEYIESAWECGCYLWIFLIPFFERISVYM